MPICGLWEEDTRNSTHSSRFKPIVCCWIVLECGVNPNYCTTMLSASLHLIQMWSLVALKTFETWSWRFKMNVMVAEAIFMSMYVHTVDVCVHVGSGHCLRILFLLFK